MSNISSLGRVQVPRKREYPKRPVVGVGGVIIEGSRALLIRRGRPPFEGQWSIPGGALEVGETLVAGVERELKEETGLNVRALELIEVFERIFPDASGRTRYHFVILDYLCEALGGTARPGGDVTEVAWAREQELLRYNLSPAATRILTKAFAMSREHASRGAGNP